jgi:sigma-B regulation protein RsbU (phosphoserine phosphatase)
MQRVAELRSGGSRWRPPQGLTGAAFWLALGFLLLYLVTLLPWVKFALLGWMQLFTGLLLLGVLIRVGVRYVRQRLLWSLRNKLIVTYLLIGLAPVVLLMTLVGISASIAAGQFSIHLADTRLRQELESLGSDNRARTDRMAMILTLRARGELGPRPRGRGGRPPLGTRCRRDCTGIRPCI